MILITSEVNRRTVTQRLFQCVDFHMNSFLGRLVLKLADAALVRRPGFHGGTRVGLTLNYPDRVVSRHRSATARGRTVAEPTDGHLPSGIWFRSHLHGGPRCFAQHVAPSSPRAAECLPCPKSNELPWSYFAPNWGAEEKRQRCVTAVGFLLPACSLLQQYSPSAAKERKAAFVWLY